MMLVVAGVTGATLYVTQQKVRVTYQKLYREQFEREVDYFTLQQDGRLSTLRERCEALAKSANLRQALLKGDSGPIYDVATEELNPSTLRNQRMLNRPNGKAAGGGAISRGNTYFRVLDANGTIFHTTEPRLGPLQQAARKRLEDQLAPVQKAMDKLEESQVGFLPRSRENNRRQVLDEVIVTKITDPESQKVLGAIVLGIPFIDVEETNMFKMSGIQSGIWVENQIHSETIPDNVREEFVHLVGDEIRTNSTAHTAFTITLGGMPQRIFFKLLIWRTSISIARLVTRRLKHRQNWQANQLFVRRVDAGL